MAMRMPAKIRYGIRILVEIGRRPEGALPLAEVERRQLISAKFAKQILQPLMKAGLVVSVRGLRGGYRLLKRPGSIRLLDVVRILSDEGDRIAPCLTRRGRCRRDPDCGAKQKWIELQEIVDAFLARTTLDDVIRAEIERERGAGDARRRRPTR
jgi:Rrf2 family protein